MSVRSERIKALIEQSKQSYQELEKTTGIKKSSLQRYASGVTTKIPLDVIEKLSKAFNVSQEYLMGWDDETKKISPEELALTEGEKKWLELYHSISDDTKAVLIKMCNSFDKLPADKQRLALDMIQVALRNQK
jgi:transcriptional regulator with XRE-family HTH domain